MSARRRKPAAESRPPDRGPAWRGIIWDLLRAQDEALRVLRDAVRSGRIPHAHLFWGPAGSGKLRAAHGLAQALLCTSDERPCGACRGCAKVARFLHPDLHVLRPLTAREEAAEDALLEAYARDRYASLSVSPPAGVGIDRVRAIKMESSKSLVEGACRVLLIPQADLMTQEAANAALKLIEEPRGETFLVLTTVDPRRLLPTVVSRCRRVRFRMLPADLVEGIVREETDAGEETARLAAALSGGNLPQALELAREDLVSRRDEVLDLMAPAGGDLRELLRRAESWRQRWDAASVQSFSGLLGLWQQDLLTCICGGDAGRIVHRDRMDRIRQEAGAATVEEIRRRLELVEELVESIRQYVNPELALKAFLMAWERGETPDRMLRGV